MTLGNLEACSWNDDVARVGAAGPFLTIDRLLVDLLVDHRDGWHDVRGQ